MCGDGQSLCSSCRSRTRPLAYSEAGRCASIACSPPTSLPNPTPPKVSPRAAAYGASHVLWDNLWGTNYIMWWPFVVPPPAPFGESATYFPQDGNNDFAARFTITL